jgi:hypothetical protein
MPNEKTAPSRPDWESARAAIAVPGPPPLVDGTKFDKTSPDGPPTPQQREIPKHLLKIVSFFTGIVKDEGLVLDLCLEHCMELVERNVKAKMVGIDYYADGGSGGSGPYTPVNYAAVAGPLAVELYKQTLKSIEGRQEEYGKLVEEMNREREKNSPGGPRIIVSP